MHHQYQKEKRDATTDLTHISGFLYFTIPVTTVQGYSIVSISFLFIEVSHWV